MPRSPDRSIPGSYGREYPWPSGMEKENSVIVSAAKGFYGLWKKLFEDKADFAERAKRVDAFFKEHEGEDGVEVWMGAYDFQWDKTHASMLKEKAHQDWQKEHGKRS